ncbi:selenoprotein T [Haematococcus lacustris]|uniref:Selenoprotein T n=1 Tax=Haematococcus lacustris TaxID=44745 RepID=A0A6A0ABS2_HAELA|nr:selenoprotein T [Haematococcus lacustris]
MMGCPVVRERNVPPVWGTSGLTMDTRVVWGLLPVLLLLLSNAFSLSPAAAGPLDVDGGRSQGRVHVAINALRQVQGFVRQEFPNVEVLATPYPVALPKALLAKGVQVVQYGVLAVCLAGDKLFQTIGVPTPALYMQHVAPNRFGTAMGAWLVGNMAQSSLTQTGAFEVDESCLAACTQLTWLECPNSFPGLSQLTKLRRVRMHNINSLSAVTELASLPHLAHLELGSWVSTDQLGSSQRFMLPSLTVLEVTSIDASLLAALDCPQLQHLVFRTESDPYKCLCVDSVPSLHACVGSLLKHCGYVRLKCGPDVTLTAVLEALAPWQPSAAALSSTCDGMGLLVGGEDAISASHLELLPSGLQDLSFMGCTLLPDALHPIYANGERIFSKLHAQRMPSSEELRKGLQGAGLTHITQLQASRGAAGQQQGALGL